MMGIRRVARVISTLWQDIRYYDALEVAHARTVEELIHLRRHVADVQRDCSRHLQEARDAREELAKVSKQAPSVSGALRFVWRKRGGIVLGCVEAEQWVCARIKKVYRPELESFYLWKTDISHGQGASVDECVASAEKSILSLYEAEQFDRTAIADLLETPAESGPAPSLDPRAGPVGPFATWREELDKWRLYSPDGIALGMVARDVAGYRGRAYLNGSTWIHVTADTASECALLVVQTLDRSFLLEGLTVDFEPFRSSPAQTQNLLDSPESSHDSTP